MPSINLSLVGDSIGFLTLVWKTLYDVWWNPKKFRKEFADASNKVKAAEAKRHRSDVTTLIAFSLLAVSYLCLLFKDFYESH